MRKIKGCDLCGNGRDYEEHLVVLAIIHLEIEHHPKRNFSPDTIFEKYQMLRERIRIADLHKNLTNAVKQLKERAERK